MTTSKHSAHALVFAFSTMAAIHLSFAQEPAAPPAEPPPQPPGNFGGPGGPGGPGGRGGMGGPMREPIKLLEKFDTDGDKVLRGAEVKEARAFALKTRAERRQSSPGGRGRPGGPGGFGPRADETPATPGPKLTPAEVKNYPGAPLYDAQVLRTIFLTFEDPEWEGQLADFKDTDVELPARMTVDGKTFRDVGVHMRGMSSFMMVGAGRKRSLGLSLDLVNHDQKIGGYRTMHLLNSHEDPSFLRPVLFTHVAREYVPAPKANIVRVVINGESWGVYVNQQPFTKEFTDEWFGSKKGTRWKVPGNPGARGGLEYIGEDVAEYQKRFELKSKEDPAAWEHLINLCRVLNQTPADQLEAKISPILDVDEALRFLALDNVFINGDGYWTRSSDYALYEDVNGRFHVIPHDTNETFSLPGGGPRPNGGRPRGQGAPDGATASTGPQPGETPRTEGAPPTGPDRPGLGGGFPPDRPGFGGGFGPGRGPGVRGVELDPLVAAADDRKPLLAKLLAVPALRERYVQYVREIATTWLDWNKLGPIVQQYQNLIGDEVAKDTRKLDSTEDFVRSVSSESKPAGEENGRRRSISLRDFVEQRRAYLLSWSEKPAEAVAATPSR